MKIKVEDWPWDRLGYSPITDAEGLVLGCEIRSLMTIEEVKAKYPDANITGRKEDLCSSGNSAGSADANSSSPKKTIQDKER